MTPLLILKLIHVLGAIVAVGANVTYAFWMRRAGLQRDRLLFVIESIRRLDRRIANPAYGVLLVTGLLMVLDGAYSLTAGWLATAVVLFVLTALVGIAFFAPAIRRQLVEAQADPASAAYAAAAARSSAFGVLTTAIVLVIVALMVTKPF